MSKILLEQYIRAFLNEGEHDQNTNKCIIVLGPAGVGKSSTINEIVGGTGLKYLNSDQFLELAIDKKLSSINKEESKELSRADFMSMPEYSDQLKSMRDKAGELNDERLTLYTGIIFGDEENIKKTNPEKYRKLKKYESAQNNLGIVIEGTASREGSYEWFHNSFIKPLKSKGYDILVVGVYAPFYVCNQRNKSRGKSGGREVNLLEMKHVFYGFVQEYSKIINLASNDIAGAITILNTQDIILNGQSKSQLEKYVYMITHEGYVEKRKKEIVEKVNKKIKDLQKEKSKDDSEVNKKISDKEIKKIIEDENLEAELSLLEKAKESSSEEISLVRDSISPNSIPALIRRFLNS